MRFYNAQQRYYCGIDLHARSLYVCILDQAGQVLVHRNLPAKREELLEAIAPYRDDLVIAVECIFSCYWVADLLDGAPRLLKDLPACADEAQALISARTSSTVRFASATNPGFVSA